MGLFVSIYGVVQERANPKLKIGYIGEISTADFAIDVTSVHNTNINWMRAFKWYLFCPRTVTCREITNGRLFLDYSVVSLKVDDHVPYL